MTRLPDRSRSRSRRRGLTLLEVVISMAIFLFSITAIMQLTSMATDRAIDVQQQAMGTMLAQRKLAEVMVGATPLSSSGYTAFTDDGMEDWQWKLDASQNSVNGVWNVQVSVKYEAPESGFKPVVVELGQMVLDPTLRGSTLDAPPTQSLNNSNVPTGNGSSSNSGSSSGQGGGAAAGNNKTGGTSKTGGGTPGGAGRGGGGAPGRATGGGAAAGGPGAGGATGGAGGGRGGGGGNTGGGRGGGGTGSGGGRGG